MCGIAGIIHRGGNSASVGSELTSMLQALRHRGPDSTGFALYGAQEPGRLIMRFKIAEGADLGTGLAVREDLQKRKAEVDRIIRKLDAKIVSRLADGFESPL